MGLEVPRLGHFEDTAETPFELLKFLLQLGIHEGKGIQRPCLWSLLWTFVPVLQMVQIGGREELLEIANLQLAHDGLLVLLLHRLLPLLLGDSVEVLDEVVLEEHPVFFLLREGFRGTLPLLLHRLLLLQQTEALFAVEFLVYRRGLHRKHLLLRDGELSGEVGLALTQEVVGALLGLVYGLQQPLLFYSCFSRGSPFVSP